MNYLILSVTNYLNAYLKESFIIKIVRIDL